MPRDGRKIPAYRLHKARNLAVVSFDGRNIYLGKFDSPESRQEYDRVIGEWLARGRQAPVVVEKGTVGAGTGSGLTVAEVIVRYWAFAADYYVRDGQPAAELGNIKDALRPVRRAYGSTEANSFGPVALKAVRKRMIDDGLARNTVNERVGKIRRMFKWAVAEELVSPTVLLGLQAVGGLRPGRSGVRETAPIRPVMPEQVAAALPFVSAPVRAMIQLQDLSGMRPGEVMTICTGDVDRSEEIWVYRPAQHKTQDKGFTRAIPLGPKAQAILATWLKDDPLAFVFTPTEAVAGRNAKAAARRKDFTRPSRVRRSAQNPTAQKLCGYYRKASYNQAIREGCDRAFPHPELGKIPEAKLTPEQRVELKAWRKAHRWHPNQLRHAAATRIRKAFGLEGAQVTLGGTISRAVFR